MLILIAVFFSFSLSYFLCAVAVEHRSVLSGRQHHISQICKSSYTWLSCWFPSPQSGIEKDKNMSQNLSIPLQLSDYTLIAFDKRVTFWLQLVGPLPCACAFAALFVRRLAYNHYANAHACNAANAHAQGSDWAVEAKKLLSRWRQSEYRIERFAIRSTTYTCRRWSCFWCQNKSVFENQIHIWDLSSTCCKTITFLVFRNKHPKNSNATTHTFYTYTSLKTYNKTSLILAHTLLSEI